MHKEAACTACTVHKSQEQTCTPDFACDLLTCFAFFRSKHTSSMHLTNC